MKEHQQRPAEPPAVTRRPASLARKCECSGSGPCECEEESMQREASGRAPSAVLSAVHGVLASGGRALDGDVRDEMESRFGHDFGNVRVHDDSSAAASARAVAANAYTVGNHVVFGSPAWSPSSYDGRRLLAHELTHVMQQRDASSSTPLEISDPSDAAEREADRVADDVMRSGS